MDQLQQQVARARRRLVVEQFLKIATRTLLAAVILIGLAVLVPKLWSLGFSDQGLQIWFAGWLGGGLVIGLIASIVWTVLVRRSSLDAAIEIDHRFGLKERVSSALALSPSDFDTPAGQALLGDAVRRAGRIEVAEEFRLRASPWFVLPPALWGLAILLALLVPNALPQEADATEQERIAQQVKNSAEELQKRIQESRKRAAEADLKDAVDLLAEIEGQTERMAAEQPERRDAMIELNNLRDEIEDRRDQLGGGDELKRQLDDLDDLKTGPADELAEAMKKGDFDEALQQLQDLQDQLADGEMSDEDARALAEQMNQLAGQLQDALDAHEAAKRELDEQIRQAQAAGDQQTAQDLQQQRDQLAQRDAQMSRMSNLAQSMSQCSRCMGQGDGEGAAAQLAQLAEAIEGMQSEAAEMELLNEALDQISQARDSMGCSQCQGRGCAQCQGGAGNNPMGIPGPGMGEGRGQGARPESDTATQPYDSQVPSNQGPGSAAVTGEADGPNLPGDFDASIQAAYEAARGDDSDPLVGQRVPSSDRRFVQEYYDRLRGGALEGEAVED